MNALDKLQPLSSKPLNSTRVADRLRELVQSGTLAAGEKLPSENDLARSFQVSRPVVREALRGLAMMGIVESKQGGGCFITDLTPDRLMEPLSFVLSLGEFSLDSLFQARELIDVGLAEAAARNVSAEQLERLAQLVIIGFDTIDDAVAFRVMDAEFHALVSTAASNPFLDRVSRSLYGLAMETRRLASRQTGVLQQSARDHATLVKALEKGNARAAGRAMATHVENIRRTTMAFVEDHPNQQGTH